MKRILVAIDASNVKASMMDFACYLARLTNSRLTGFVFHLQKENKSITRSPADVLSSVNEHELPEHNWEDDYSKTVSLFKELCCNRSVNCDIQVETKAAVEELIAETRYADLAIADPTISFTDEAEVIPTVFIKELLGRAECPVIVAPENFDWINEIVFAYDGSKSSVFAMKQFTYMFPELRDRKVYVMEVCEGNEHVVTKKEKLSAWLSNYYEDVSYLVLYGKPKDELFGYLLEKEKMLVVMGAFGRSMVSSLFSRSNAELLLKAVNLPFFITHC